MKTKSEVKERFERLTFFSFVFLQYLLVFLFFFFLIPGINVLAGIGINNETIQSGLDVGFTEPVIVNVSVEPSSIHLVPNDVVRVNCTTVIENYEGEDDIQSVSAEFYDASVSFFGDSDSNNEHYTNSSCSIDKSYGDAYTAESICYFEVEYYANPGNWNCTVNVSNSYFWVNDSNSTVVETLLGIGLPDNINYGIVNATGVSLENDTNVTNYGNVLINLSLEGYAQSYEDGYAMNCSLGSVGNIDIMYEKYNLTDSIVGDLTLGMFEGNYTNLTTSAVVKEFKLDYRHSDIINDAVNTTYWRIYVPTGVAGTCTGNIVFGATLAPGV